MSRRAAQGFTLLETIITITLFGVVGAMLFQYYFTGMRTSALPFTRLDAAQKLNAVMANIVSDYEYDACCNQKNTAALASLNTRVTTNYTTNYGGLCSTCTASTTYPYSFGGLTNALLVRVTNSTTGQSISHVFTVQQ